MVEDEMAMMTRQLARQRGWLLEHWRYLIWSQVLPGYHHRPKALDVGCGPGLVMSSLSDLLDVQGLDHDPLMVEECKRRDQEATLGEAERLPFPEGAFDIVYCSFLLVWVRDAGEVLDEMLRVSRGWVMCLAEPDYVARIDFPPELEGLTSMIIEGTREAGGDPCIGRRLRSLFSKRGLDAEVGMHPGAWSLERLRDESEAEWEWARSMVGEANQQRLANLRPTWDRALEQGTLFQHNPIFYAIARKPK